MVEREEPNVLSLSLSISLLKHSSLHGLNIQRTARTRNQLLFFNITNEHKQSIHDYHQAVQLGLGSKCRRFSREAFRCHRVFSPQRECKSSGLAHFACIGPYSSIRLITRRRFNRFLVWRAQCCPVCLWVGAPRRVKVTRALKLISRFYSPAANKKTPRK
jgi:hypothetical protein